MALESAVLDIQESYSFGTDEDGNEYFHTSGYRIIAAVGRLRFSFGKVFDRYSLAEQKLEQLCGNFSNGFNAKIDVGTDEDPGVNCDWEYQGIVR
jgi:hypothetical protein